MLSFLLLCVTISIKLYMNLICYTGIKQIALDRFLIQHHLRLSSTRVLTSLNPDIYSLISTKKLQMLLIFKTYVCISQLLRNVFFHT